MKERILVVDDEAAFTHMMRRVLELMGHYEVREENFSPAAVDTALEFRPDLVLLDLMMPDMSGAEVRLNMKKDDSLRHTPVLFITAAPLINGLPEGFGLSHDETCLSKMVDVDKLLSAIRTKLNRRPS